MANFFFVSRTKSVKKNLLAESANLGECVNQHKTGPVGKHPPVTIQNIVPRLFFISTDNHQVKKTYLTDLAVRDCPTVNCSFAMNHPEAI